jgi:probable F420-dependent oxidoreductase
MTVKKSHGIGVGVFQVIADLFTGDPAVIAKRAEELGFDSYWLPEHAAIPQGSEDVYPGKVEGGSAPDYLFKMPDPLIGLSRAAAVTSTINLGTGVALVPERHPVLAAKEIASLDHYSKGRFIYGIGAGWNEAECTMMGGDFAHRWAQVKEYIFAMKSLWTGEYASAEGKYANFPSSVCRPTPWRKPHPPIMLGSIGSPNVYRRVAQWGDGWLPFVINPQEVADGRAEILTALAALEGLGGPALEALHGAASVETALAELQACQPELATRLRARLAATVERRTAQYLARHDAAGMEVGAVLFDRGRQLCAVGPIGARWLAN